MQIIAELRTDFLTGASLFHSIYVPEEVIKKYAIDKATAEETSTGAVIKCGTVVYRHP